MTQTQLQALLSNLASGAITADDAHALITASALPAAGGGIQLIKSGKLRVAGSGTYIDCTGAQAIAVLSQRKALCDLILRYKRCAGTVESRDGRKPGEKYEAYMLGDLLAGYRQQHADSVAEFNTATVLTAIATK